MRTIAAIAKKEVLDGIRNRWILATTLLLSALAITLAFLGSAPTGSVGAAPLAVTLVSLSSLTILLLPLIALLLSYDSICGEFERGTMLLLLSYPVSRPHLVLGKFLGHVLILGFATLIGYGSAAIPLAVGGAPISGWQAYLAMIGSSVLLGSTFLALGYLVSASVADRGAAGGLVIGVWLLFVLIFDMALLGLLVVDQGKTITTAVLNGVLLLNPADIYRVLNLSGLGGSSQFTGMAGLSQDAVLPAAVLLGALVAWTVVPLILSALVLHRRQL